MKERKKILWLVSWYPNRQDPFDGDFIQRHARAAAIVHDVHVIFVKAAPMTDAVEEVWNYQTGLTEQLIYFRDSSGPFSSFRRFMVGQALFRKAIRTYISNHGMPDLVHVHIPWKAGLQALWMQKQFHIPYLVSEHWGIYEKTLPHNFYTLSFTARSGIKKILNHAKTLITVSEFLGHSIVKVASTASCVIIPNVVDTTLFHPGHEKYERFSFIHVSNMVPLKNTGEILTAFHSLVKQDPGRDVQLVMVGNRNDHYVNQAAEMGLLNRNVFFRGEIPYTEVAAEMRRTHCLVLFSDSETFSCVAAEALCCGIPVIASAAGALPELVNESNGILVEKGNTLGLQQAMAEILNHYESYNKGRIAAESSARFGYNAVSENFRQLYQRFVKTASGAAVKAGTG